MTAQSEIARISGKKDGNSIPVRLEEISRRLDTFQGRTTRTLRLIDIVDGEPGSPPPALLAEKNATTRPSAIPGWLRMIEDQLQALALVIGETENRLSVATGSDMPDEEYKEIGSFDQ